MTKILLGSPVKKVLNLDGKSLCCYSSGGTSLNSKSLDLWYGNNLRPEEVFVREFVALSILQSNENIIVFGEGLDFTPEFGLIKDSMLFHDLDMGEFKFKPGLFGKYLSSMLRVWPADWSRQICY